MPDITSYFLMAITLNMIAFIWFIYVNRCLSKNEIPKCLEKIGIIVKRVFCLCFPPDKKESSKVANADITTILVKNSAKPNSIENLGTVKPKHKESLEKAAAIDITVKDNTDSVVLPKPGSNSIEYLTEISKNAPQKNNIFIQAKPNQAIVIEADDAKLDLNEKPRKEKKTEERKCICKFCDRCSECEAEFKKDKDKGKSKKDLELILQALNWLAFLIMLICMLIGNLGIWLNLKK